MNKNTPNQLRDSADISYNDIEDLKALVEESLKIEATVAVSDLISDSKGLDDSLAYEAILQTSQVRSYLTSIVQTIETMINHNFVIEDSLSGNSDDK